MHRILALFRRGNEWEPSFKKSRIFAATFFRLCWLRGTGSSGGKNRENVTVKELRNARKTFWGKPLQRRSPVRLEYWRVLFTFTVRYIGPLTPPLPHHLLPSKWFRSLTVIFPGSFIHTFPSVFLHLPYGFSHAFSRSFHLVFSSFFSPLPDFHTYSLVRSPCPSWFFPPFS